MPSSYIKIKNAREHNLKSVDIEIPHYQITCFTGVSGSGKSSLVYDLIYRESQRRYLESFSSYARQFFGHITHPEVESISGLMPAISVDQKTINRNPRSTVGTLSELYDLLRLLYARCGRRSVDFPDLRLTRSLFSFNNPEGACPVCNGLGVEDRIDPELLIADSDKSLRQGALKITTPSGYTIYSQVTIDVLDRVCRSEGFNVDIPWKDLTREQQNIVLNGSDKITIPYGKHTLESRMKWKGITAKPREEGVYKGILPVMENILRIDRNPNILRFARTIPCRKCNGQRLNEATLSVTFNEKTIGQMSAMTIKDLTKEFSNTAKATKDQALHSLSSEIVKRTSMLEELGLGYLTLNRNSSTLSGGEAQRIRLSTQVTNGLRGIMYVLDEPSAGLHPHDNERLIRILRQLRDNGNTVLVVEHDASTILSADRLVDMGPGAGKAGGKILFHQPVEALSQLDIPKSKTLHYLRLENTGKWIRSPKESNSEITVKKASLYNLKNIEVSFKKKALNVVTGVSGAGKSTLVMQVLGESLSGNGLTFAGCKDITGTDDIDRVIAIDQTPIGRTPRSNPATYVKVFDHIRKLYAAQPGATKKKWKPTHFSFNTRGGRCETCEGAGVVQTGMHFMGHVTTVCETCNGRRFDEGTLSVTYNGKNISEVLNMEIEEAQRFFKDEKSIYHYLEVMNELGLGYLSLGQPATTLSGGEAQRLKLAAELVHKVSKPSLYLFDEPTTGLHAYDVQILLKALHQLTDHNHTVIVIEHDQQVILSADHVVDLGPGGGDAGGKLIYSGPVSGLSACETSLTARYLKNAKTKIQAQQTAIREAKIKEPILLEGVNTHNLKNIDVEIPRNKLTVITGISGSGKSSLAFDTLFAEGQLRYTESFSSYARRMTSKITRPDIRMIHGLTPTLAINGRSVIHHPRATIGTVTGIYDLYRILFSRLADLSEQNGQHPLSGFFSFNHEAGACKACKGLGYRLTADPGKLISNPELSLPEGAMKGSKTGRFYGDQAGQHSAILNAMGNYLGINYTIPWNQLDEYAQKAAMYGTGEKIYQVEWQYERKNRKGTHSFQSVWPGFVHYIDEEYQRRHETEKGQALVPLMKKEACPVCGGARLKEEVLKYKLAGKNIYELSCMEAGEAATWFAAIYNELNEQKQKIGKELFFAIDKKLSAMQVTGLGYLSVNRSTLTLSGGEARRLRLISHLGGELTGLTYVLDEPTIGLHHKDTGRLLKLLSILSEENTVVVIEHDEEIIRAADHIIELGSGAGVAGGRIITSGSLEKLLQNKNSITAKYLTKKPSLFMATPNAKDPMIKIHGANANNLKNTDILLPSGGISIISGVSGSGKSSLLFDVIAASATQKKPVNCTSTEGLDIFDAVKVIDQQSLTGNVSSSLITYLALYEYIRDLFAETKEAGEQQFNKSHFSFNMKGGRCETCKGQGQIKISMDFLADLWVTCPDCNGTRFNSNVLGVKTGGLNIAEVLELTVQEAINFYGGHRKLKPAFELLAELGLGHLKLGQPSSTFSGGEAQRLKMTAELIKPDSGKCLYLLDEPTTGLHFQDIEKLMTVLNRIAANGHALYIIEHHPWLVGNAGYVIELGPEGGKNGGYVLFQHRKN